MVNKTLTRMDLADAVHSQVGLSRNESADLVEAVWGMSLMLWSLGKR